MCDFTHVGFSLSGTHLLFCFVFSFMKDYFCTFRGKSGGCWFLPSFINLAFSFTMKKLLGLLVWNQVQDNTDWNQDIQSRPFEMKKSFSNTRVSWSPWCFQCTLKWGNLLLPMRCVILRELIIFAVLQGIGSPISSSTAGFQIIQGQREKSHYIGNFPHSCSEKL